MRRAGAWLRPRWASWRLPACEVAGFGSLGLGAWMVHPAAACAVAAVACFNFAYGPKGKR